MTNLWVLAQPDALQHNGWLVVKQNYVVCEICLREEGFVKNTWKQLPLKTEYWREDHAEADNFRILLKSSFAFFILLMCSVWSPL